MSNKQFCPILPLRNTVRTGVHKLPSPFKAQCDGGLRLALFRVEALVVVPLHAEKLHMLPGLGVLLVLGTDLVVVPIV